MSRASRVERVTSTEALRARRRPSRSYRPSPLWLEARELLAALAAQAATINAPTDAEQYMLELINRARANPAAEAQRLAALARTDPVLIASTYGWDLNRFVQTMSVIGPQPPLAFNTRLIEAARDQSAVMLAQNNQVHSPAGYLTNPSVGRADDGLPYLATSAANGGGWSTGENIFAYSGNVGGQSVVDYVDYFHAAFLIDWGNPRFGHLKNVLAPGPGTWTPGAHSPMTEIGLGLLNDVVPTTPPASSTPIATNQGLNVGPSLITQEFAYRSGVTFLTGTIYADRDIDGFYSIGEGLGGVTIRAVGRLGQGTYQTATWGSGGYSLQLPAGTYDVTASGGGLLAPQRTTITVVKDNVGWSYRVASALADQPVAADYDGDGRTELAVYRDGSAQWYVDGQTGATAFGGAGIDIPVPGDYDGLGRTEMAVFRPSTMQWFVLGPQGGRLIGTFGGIGIDVPVPGNYDGLGGIEPAVYRPSTAQWFALGPNGGRLVATFGAANLDIPVPGDYDGLGYTEPAVYRPTTGDWYVYGPGGGRLLANFGQPGVDIPMPGDYDGLGHLQPAVYRPTTGQFFILSPGGWRAVSVGLPNVDVPIRGDFDGDGKSDPAVYRPSTGTWAAALTTGGTLTRSFGQGGAARPVESWLTDWPGTTGSSLTQALAASPTAARSPSTGGTVRLQATPSVESAGRSRPARNILLAWARGENPGQSSSRKIRRGPAT